MVFFSDSEIVFGVGFFVLNVSEDSVIVIWLLVL